MAESATPSVQVVGNAFVEQYYHILHHSPDMVHKFYQDSSFVSRPDEDGAMITVTTMKGINDKICSLDYTAYKAEIKTADAQESYKDGVLVLVTGFLTSKEDNRRKKFTQSFFLAPQDKGYFVLNDVFRYLDETKPTDGIHMAVEERNNDQTPSLIPVKEEAPAVEEEALDVFETEDPPASENNSVEPEPEPQPKPTLHPVENIKSVVEESVSSVEDAPKMSYASILSSQTKKRGPAPGPTKVYVLNPTPAKTENKTVANVAQNPPPEAPAPAPIASGSINVHDDGDIYSVHVRNLPHSVTVSQIETEFKKFGSIKQGGIQIRSNKLGFCFGFVEFQDASSVQTAIQNSPVVIGGKEAIVELKRTIARGIGRGRFSTGRGGFRGRGEFSGRGRGPGGDSYHNQGRGRRGGSVHYTTATSA